jgi:hypothetical protein
VFQHQVDIVSLLHVPIQHATNKVNTLWADCERHSKVSIHDLIDAVERILLVDDGVEQDAQCPDILFLPTIRFTSKNLGSRIICSSRQKAPPFHISALLLLTNGAHENVKRAALDVRSASEVDQLDVTLSVQNDVFVLNITMDHECLRM